MPPPQDMAPHLSSPPSEGGAESYQYEDTPDTRLTIFSPQDDSAKSSRLLNALTLNTAKNNNIQPIKFGVQTSSSVHRMASMDSITSVVHDKDPFISSTPEKIHNSTKLSATASAFEPSTCRLSSTNLVSSNGPTNNATTPRPIACLPETIARSPTTGFEVYVDLPLSSAFSHDLKLSRSMRITASSGRLDAETITQYIVSLQSPAHGGAFHCTPGVFPIGRAFYIRATNVRDAARILQDTTFKPHTWTVEAVSAEEINKATESNTLAHEHEGLHTMLVCSNAHLSDAQVQGKIREHFKHYDFFAMIKQPTSLIPGTMQWVIEWSDADATRSCASYLYNVGWVTDEGLISFLLAPFSPDSQATGIRNTFSDYRVPAHPDNTLLSLDASFGNMSLYGSQLPMQSPGPPNMSLLDLSSPSQGSQWSDSWSVSRHSSRIGAFDRQPSFSRRHTPASSGTGFSMMSPMSQTYSVVGSFSLPLGGPMSGRISFSSPRPSQGFQRSSEFHRSNDRRQNATRVNRAHFSPPGPHHNHVDINKIREGTDVRTTIMLRNIPNKVDQAMLKNIIDESSWGKYDFMYLRIDFANDCNVGYSFINFVDPLDIIDFVNARGNQRWNCFKSDKVAEISYATIQGKDCLVQKFRNSSVMLEQAHYRPKLYYTSNGPVPDMAGQEEPFPEPDNQSKMKRSCENAEHVGLFTPNAGQHFRDEQRRRRSQYDRGTRLAALEEYDYGIYSHQEPMH
ncbi:hypothetical protein N0V93_004938 [Gnomoniopsis smithogilvyi]|uniref:RRM domain-containing protein n=1 Tax=Gnomoniopsis smithogilvyi TaxID=1191159 RepID=A0A9W8YTI6_9PEZI|nr:hypothetical protein N0V93_004938 [Gnomoniopsis smithogilvyi]